MLKAKRLLARSIALLVIAALSISVMPVFSLSYNETGDISDEKPVQNEYCEDPDLSGDMDGLRYIDSAEIERQGFIRRLKEKESLNSYAFLNRDGTESVVLFPDNIKYVDESGVIVEKDTAIVGNPSGGFTVKANDYGVLFPENIKDGLQFEYLEGCISMIPDGAGGEYIIEDNSISYLNVFGENTILRYTPLLNGIKEDIVISGYSGINSFGFDIRSGNLRFSDKGTGRVLVNENGEPVIEFVDVIACDSEGKLAAGTLLIEENGENGYHLTVSIPEEFLADPETVYPVTIDPTIYESSDGSYIQDSPIFDGASYQNSNFGYYLVDYAGLVSSYGNARTAMRLYGLENHPIYKTLDAEEIVSVKISVKGTTSGSPAFVNLYRISSNVTWDESTVTYNNVGSFDTLVNKGAYLSTTQRTEFDITSFAKGWKNLSYTNTMRVIFTASSGTSTWFYSSHPMNNAGTVDNRPYVIFTYQIKNLMEGGTYYIRNRHIDRFLQPVNDSSSANAVLELNAFSGSDSQKWEVISRGNGYYTIRNLNSGYVLSVPSGSYSTYDVQLIQASDTQADGQLWRIYMTSYCGFAIKPKSACGPNDGSGWSDRTMSVADGNDGNGALVTQRPYVYNNSFKDEWYLMPIDISETVNYEIENSQLGSYLRPEDGYTYINNALELWEYLNSYSQKWKFTSAGDGYYKISPYYNSTIAVTIASGSETAENGGVIQYTYSSDNNRQKWFIYKVPHGYALKAKSAGINNLVLSVSEGNLGNGAVVSQRAYVNNLSYKEEWHLNAPDLNAVADGVYYISIESYYLESSFPRAKDHVSVDVYELCSANAQVQYRAAQMWRIKNIGNNRYSIRPLHKLDMGLNVYESDADIVFIGSNDTRSYIDNHAEWIIEQIGNKFLIKNQGDPNKTLTAESMTNASNVSVSPYSSGNGLQLWSIVAVPDLYIPKDVLFYSAASGYIVTNQQRYIAPKQVQTIQDLDLMVGVIDADNINQNGIWSVTPSNTDCLSYNSSTGTITGIKSTTTGVTVTCARSISGVTCSKSYTANITEIANGTYLLKNKQNFCYAKVKNGTLSNNQNAVQYELDTTDSEKWIFNLDNRSGYYTIKSKASEGTSFYLQVYNNSTQNDTVIVLQAYSGNAFPLGAQWRVERVHETAFKIIPRTGESPDGIREDFVLATDKSNSNNNVNLVQGDYIDNTSYRDEWFIMSWINLGFSTDNYTDGCQYGERQSYRYANKFFNKLVDPDRELTFLKYHHYNKGSNRTASKTDFSVNGSFSNDIDFMVYIGHGLIADSFSGNYLHYNCASNGAHHTSDCSNSQYNAYNTDMEFGSSTSKLRWVWLYTCNFLTTGTYVSDSTLKGMMNGAHIVMGYTSQAYLCDDMAEKFAEYLSSGETIIRSYFKAGNDGEAHATSSHHIQKVLYIPQAANETIYSPYVYYDYTSDSVCIETNDIQDSYN